MDERSLEYLEDRILDIILASGLGTEDILGALEAIVDRYKDQRRQERAEGAR